MLAQFGLPELTDDQFLLVVSGLVLTMTTVLYYQKGQSALDED